MGLSIMQFRQYADNSSTGGDAHTSRSLAVSICPTPPAAPTTVTRSPGCCRHIKFPSLHVRRAFLISCRMVMSQEWLLMGSVAFPYSYTINPALKQFMECWWCLPLTTTPATVRSVLRLLGRGWQLLRWHEAADVKGEGARLSCS